MVRTIERKQGLRGEAPEECTTLAAYLLRDVKIWGDRVAMRQKDFGIWHEYTWAQCYEMSKLFALGMLSLGLKRGDKACLLGDNEVETYWAVYGMYGVGAVVVARPS